VEVSYKPGWRLWGLVRKIALSSKDASFKLYCNAVSVPSLPLFKFKVRCRLSRRFMMGASM